MQQLRGKHAVITGVLTVLAAAITGALTTKPLIGHLMQQQAIHNGPWTTSNNTGSSDANPWERAAIAIAGLYALSRDEAIYFTAFTDSSGNKLRGDCRYRVRGAAPSARWWSLTLYGADHYLVPNSADVYAQSPASLPPMVDGRFDIAVAPNVTGPATLPSPASGAFSLTLRLYNPPTEVLGQLPALALPEIQREGCP
mgnify:CR=1 FL=1